MNAAEERVLGQLWLPTVGPVADLSMAPIQGVADSQHHIAGCHGPCAALAGGGLPVMAAVQQEDLGNVPLCYPLTNTLQRGPPTCDVSTQLCLTMSPISHGIQDPADSIRSAMQAPS